MEEQKTVKPAQCPYRSRCGYWQDGKCYRQPDDSKICKDVFKESYLTGWKEALQAVKEGREIVTNEQPN